MIEATVKIEFVTPAFVGNDEPNNVALNEKALKGLLRFWWRAFLSDPSWDYKKLFEEEEKIFGSQNKASSFSILIMERTEGNQGEFKSFLESEERRYRKKFFGIKYLFYTKMRKARGAVDLPKFIEPGATYTIKFFAKDNNTMGEVLKALWFLENFGGIGSRSRRGAGSFVVKDIEISGHSHNNLVDISEKFLCNSKSNRNQIKDLIKGGIDSFTNSSRRSYNIPQFTSFSSHSKIGIYQNNSWISWLDAVNDIGNMFKNYRYYRNERFREQASLLHQYFVDGKNREALESNPPDKVYFGLPITYSFKDKNDDVIKVIDRRGKEVNLTAKAEPDSMEDIGRRASPLFFRIGRFPVDNGNYYIVLSKFVSKFLPENAKVSVYLEVDENHEFHFYPKDQRMEQVLNAFLDSLRGVQWIR